MATINYREFFALLKQMNGATKEDIVWQYSNYATDSLSTFASSNPDGYKKMLIELRTLTKTNDKTETKRLRSGILHRLQKYGIDTTNWSKVNAFLERPRIAGKRLYDMDHNEMAALITKLESILQKEKKRKEREDKLALLN